MATAFGQIGDGSQIHRSTPVEVPGATDVVAVSAGNWFSLAVRRDGTVLAWGWNVIGQLGDGSTTDRFTPGAVAGLTDVVAVAASDYHSLALRRDGTVWTWGVGQAVPGGASRVPVQVPGLAGVTRIAAGGRHSLALKADGTAWAWGLNADGQLGDRTLTNRSTPVRVYGLDNVTGVSAGSGFSTAVRADGSVWVWGDGSRGQLGASGLPDQRQPLRLSGIPAAASVDAGYWSSLALLRDGRLWAWGYNTTPRGPIEPHDVGGLDGVVSFSMGYFHGLAIASPDRTAPTVSDQGPDRAPDGANGWYVEPVSNRFTAADADAGLADPSQASFTVSSGAEEGAAVVIRSGPVADRAGNINPGIDAPPVKIDLSDPLVAITSPGDGAVATGPTIDVSGSASDAISGLATVSVNGVPATVDGGTWSATVPLQCGDNDLTATATDVAGRTATHTIRVSLACVADDPAPLPVPTPPLPTPPLPPALV